MFFNIFIDQHFIKDNKDVFLSYDTCKAFLLSMGWTAKGNFEESIFSKTERRLKDFRDWLGEQYSHRQFSDIKRWIELVSDYAEKNFSNRFIFSELYMLNYDEFRNWIDTIVEDIGIPMVFNKNQQCISKLPEEFETEQFLQFFVMLNFMDYVCSNMSCCPIAEYCKTSSPIYEEDVCMKDPLSTVNRDEICHFALFLKSYGFDKVAFK
jgi:hypothetical protein